VSSFLAFGAFFTLGTATSSVASTSTAASAKKQGRYRKS
jgi:hypothetical protein